MALSTRSNTQISAGRSGSKSANTHLASLDVCLRANGRARRQAREQVRRNWLACCRTLDERRLATRSRRSIDRSIGFGLATRWLLCSRKRRHHNNCQADKATNIRASLLRWPAKEQWGIAEKEAAQQAGPAHELYQFSSSSSCVRLCRFADCTSNTRVVCVHAGQVHCCA